MMKQSGQTSNKVSSQVPNFKNKLEHEIYGRKTAYVQAIDLSVHFSKTFQAQIPSSMTEFYVMHRSLWKSIYYVTDAAWLAKFA